jgi:serine/threonine-protein kinase
MALRLERGHLVFPPGVDVTDESWVPDLPMRVASDTSPSIARTMSPPAPIALGFLGLAFVGAGVLLFLFAVGVGLWATINDQSGPALSSTPTDVEPLLVEPAAVAAARVRVDSTPTGAEIVEDGVVIGNTPFDVSLQQAETRTVEVRAVGYEARTVRIDAAHPMLSVTLPSLRKAPPSTSLVVEEPAVSPGTSEPATSPPEAAMAVEPESPPAVVTPQVQKIEEVRNPFSKQP